MPHPTPACKVMCAIPAYTSKVSIRTADGLVASADLIHKLIWLAENCQVSSTRNSIAAQFLSQTEFDVLVMIDSDIAFKRDDFARLIGHDLTYPILAGIYTNRSVEQTRVNMVPLPEFPPPNADGIVECRRVATGFMRLTRAGLETIQSQFVNRYYIDQKVRKYNFFQDGLMESGEWMTDDYAFCDLARRAGLRVYADSKIQLGHEGLVCYQAHVNFDQAPQTAQASSAA